MFQGIIEFKNTFLADPDWCNIPWSAASGNKAPFDELVDILLVLPELSGQRQGLGMTADPQEFLSRAVSSIREGERMESVLETWYESFKETVPGPLYHPELSKIDTIVDNAELGKLFPVAFYFPAFAVGQNLVYYWVAMMSVHAHLCFTYRMIAEFLTMLDTIGRSNLPCTCSSPDETLACLHHFSMEALPPLGPREQWPRTLAYNICQSVEHFMLRKMRGFGSASIMPALALVKGFWKHAPGDWSREIAWVDDMLGRIRSSGSNIARALENN